MQDNLERKLSSLRLISQAKLQHILCSISGNKDFIIGAGLIKPLEKVCGVSWLKKQGIEKVYKFDPKQISTTSQCVVFFIPACLLTLKRVLDHIHCLLSNQNADVSTDLPGRFQFHVIVLPKVLQSFKLLLEEEGLYGLVGFYSFQWELMHLDSGILSLEFPLFKQLYIKHDASLLSTVSNSLWTLTQVTGRPKLIIAMGANSCSVLDMYDVFCDNFDVQKHDSDLGAILIIDRDQDYTSALLTPSTYSALLNEMFTIKSGYLELDTKNTKIKRGKLNFNIKQDDVKSEVDYIYLNSYLDQIYSDIRYKHFSEVFSLLSAQAKSLRTESQKSKSFGLLEMKQYVATKLQQVSAHKRDLSKHVSACETIVKEIGHVFEQIQNVEQSMINNHDKRGMITYLEELLCTDIHKQTSLRLICLLSLTEGISYDEYTSLTTKYLHAFGYNYTHVFQNLSNAGLFVQPTQSRLSVNIPSIGTIGTALPNLPKWQNAFQSNVNRLKQIPKDNKLVNLRDPNCPSYVFGGSYIPLVAQMVTILTKSANFDEFANKLSAFNNLKVGGSLIDLLKPESLNSTSLLNNLNLKSRDLKVVANSAKSNIGLKILPLVPKSVLVYFVGGVTHAEMAACHLVGQLTDSNIVIASDCVISGSDIMDSALEFWDGSGNT